MNIILNGRQLKLCCIILNSSGRIPVDIVPSQAIAPEFIYLSPGISIHEIAKRRISIRR